MFDSLCALLLRLYPAEFRRAYGAEAVQLMTDRVRHERGVFLRVRLLIDLAIDLGATSLQGWPSRKPVLAGVDGAPRFDIIDIQGPRPEALAVGMLTSLLMFASFTLLLPPQARPNASAQRSGGSGSETPGAASNHFAPQASATDPAAHHRLEPDDVYCSAKVKEGWTMSKLCQAAAFLLLALPAVAESQAFEVISIKPALSGDPRNMRMRVLANGDLSASAVPVLLLLGYAYDVPVNPSPRLSGLPGWRETYDIEAKAPANAVPPGLPAHEKRTRMQAMIRGLLADRFKLVIRVEQKTMPVYALTVASGGPNLQTSTIAEKDCIFDTGNPDSCHHFIVGRGHPLNARAVNMDDLALYIENWTDLPVVNRTAVGGLFAVETEGWTPMRLPPPPPGAPAVRFDDLPTIFTVLRKLGLELTQQEATLPVYTVERIERPAGG